MSVGHLVHVLLTVYNALAQVTQKSSGPLCGRVGRIHACPGLPDPKCHFDPSGLSLCLPGDHFCTVPVDDMVLFHNMVSDDGLVSYTTVPSSGGSGLCAGCEGISGSPAPACCKQSTRCEQDVRRTSKCSH